MDFVSHALIGVTIASSASSSTPTIVWFMFYSIFPDIAQIPLYLFVGHKNKRRYFLPSNADWQNLSLDHPLRIIFYDIPHSFLFLLLVATPLTLILGVPGFALIGYAVHLALDLFTHAGEWLIKPLYPIKTTFRGFFDVWALGWKKLVIIWAVLIILTLVLNVTRF